MAGPTKSDPDAAPPPDTTIVDANQAVAMLDRMHHWSATVVNSNGTRGFKVTVKHGGRQVSAQSKTFHGAAERAFGKLREKMRPKLRLRR